MIFSLICNLCSILSAPGNESSIFSTIKKEMSKYTNNIFSNSSNSLICQMGNKDSKRHLLIDAHIDQICMTVTYIDKNGFMSISPCGGIDCRVLPGLEVKILGKKVINGVISSVPPHLILEEDSKFKKTEQLFIDVGMDKKEIEKYVTLGDYVYFLNVPQKLLHGKVTAPGLDNKASVVSLIECARLICDKKFDCFVTFLFSSQEETSALGAKTSTFELKPTESIVVDVTFAKQPNACEDKTSNISEGPAIGFAPILSKKISKRLIDLAKDNNISYQTEIMSSTTGTNADVISCSLSGVPTTTLSIPLKYMHTPVEIIDINDINQTAKLLSKYILDKGVLQK